MAEAMKRVDLQDLAHKVDTFEVRCRDAHRPIL